MVHRAAFLSPVLGCIVRSAGALFNGGENLIFDGSDIPATSKAGSRILSKARRLDNNNGYYNSWVTNYSLKFHKCHTTIMFEERGGEEGGSPASPQHLVEFKLCPTGSCSSNGCGSNGGEYIVRLEDFVEAYTESKQEEQEYKCEMVRESCYCENAYDDEACEAQCYAQAGLDYCLDYMYDNGEEFEVREYLECREMEMNGNNNNNNNCNYQNGQYYCEQYFIGAYCSSDGKSVYLGVFTDQQCSNMAPSGTYEKYNYYGRSLPYSQKSLIGRDCISCKDNQNNNNNNYNYYNNENNNYNYNNNNNYQEEIREVCEQLYERSGKCEKNMDVPYRDTSACKYIHSILPKMEGVYKTDGSAGTASKALAWMFGITTIGLACFSFFLFRKLERAGLANNLMEDQGGVSA